MSLILCYMMRIIDVLTICFKLILLKKTLEKRKLKETNEFKESDNDDAEERE